MTKQIVVIGGGASGMSAALRAAELGASVTLLEKKEQPGKKLLLTGNGKCNYGNLYMASRYYRGHDVSFAEKIIRKWTVEDQIAFFEASGMLTFAKKNYLYPATRSAQTVVSLFTKRLKKLGVTVVTNCNVTAVQKTDRFLVATDRGSFYADKVILSMGSEAGVKDPRAFTAYQILESLGHYVYPALPTLVPLLGTEEEPWDGVRIEGSVRYKDQTEEGELQLLSDAISGIPVFQLSHAVGEDTRLRPVFVSLDFLPHYDAEVLRELLSSAASKDGETRLPEHLSGWLPKKLVLTLEKRDPSLFKKSLSELTKEDIEKICGLIKAFPYRVKGTAGFSRAQAANGGADTGEFSENCESRLCPGLYVTGELLDVDGLCGGYNLHFAFASGRIAGEDAAK